MIHWLAIAAMGAGAYLLAGCGAGLKADIKRVDGRPVDRTEYQAVADSCLLHAGLSYPRSVKPVRDNEEMAALFRDWAKWVECMGISGYQLSSPSIPPALRW